MENTVTVYALRHGSSSLHFASVLYVDYCYRKGNPYFISNYCCTHTITTNTPIDIIPSLFRDFLKKILMLVSFSGIAFQFDFVSGYRALLVMKCQTLYLSPNKVDFYRHYLCNICRGRHCSHAAVSCVVFLGTSFWPKPLYHIQTNSLKRVSFCLKCYLFIVFSPLFFTFSTVQLRYS